MPPHGVRIFHMPLLIDCYNVLHTTMPPHLAGLDEARLCHLLMASPFGGTKITVVCDGKVKPHIPAVSPVDSVKLIYSGPRRSADDLIIKQIGVDTAPRRLIVVSSDRQIQKAARRRRAKIMPSDELINVLSRLPVSAPDGAAPAPASLSSQEVEHWLSQFDLKGDELLDKRDQPWGKEDQWSN